MLMTLADINATNIKLVGPDSTKDLISSFSQFYHRPDMKITHMAPTGVVFSNDAVDISSLRVDLPNHLSSSPKRLKSAPFQAVNQYLCKFAPRRGKFDSSTAIRLGVKPGPQFRELCEGKEVVTSSGDVVLPSQVMGDQVPGYDVALVSCPTLDHVQLVLDALPSRAYLYIFHLSPSSVCNHASYQSLLASFPDAKHVMLNEHANALDPVYSGSVDLQRRLFAFNPTIFSPEDFYCAPGEDAAGNCLQARLAMQLDVLPKPFIHPRLGLEGVESAEVGETLVSGSYEDQRVENDAEVAFLGTGSALPSKYRNVSAILVRVPCGDDSQEGECDRVDTSEVDPGIVDTSEVDPGIVKTSEVNIGIVDTSEVNTGIVDTSIADTPGNKDHKSPRTKSRSLLLDCGEGTYAQLIRLCKGDVAQALDEVNTLHCVWISHMHADHHLGLMQLLHERVQSGNTQPLLVYGPTGMQRFLNAYSKLCPSLQGSFSFINNRSTLENKVLQSPDNGVFSQFEAVPVIHCYDSYGLVMEHVSGWKIVYSGDTRPCPLLVQRGQKCTLLIHEATLEDGMEEDARKKRHSTVGQAVKVGVDMQAKATLLTHFSQRYSKIPTIPENTPVSIAFDLMKVKLSHLHWVPCLLPELSKMLVDLEEEEEQQ